MRDDLATRPRQLIGRSTNRVWLGDFLRSRRERLSPNDFGFPVMRRRRSPGLRRDEVAQLAGISIAYYTWIEQGRDVNMSVDVLRAIANALKLDEAERLHLFTLVEHSAPEGREHDEVVHPTISHLLDVSSPAFAFLCDSWFNVLAATRLASATLGIDPARAFKSNLLYRLFNDPLHREMWVDWETEARMAVGMFRQALARRGSSSEGFDLLHALLDIREFERIWSAYDVRVQPSPDEFFREEPWQLRHSDAGLLRVYRLALTIPASNDHILVMCSPADSETARKFDDLLDRASLGAQRYLRRA